jgi:hypothetical protein
MNNCIKKFVGYILIFALNIMFFQLIFCQTKPRSEKEIRSNPKDIVDYYLILPDKAFIKYDDQSSFQLRKKHLKPTEERKVSIDQKNAFLQIEDQQGPMRIITTLCYFSKADKTKIFGLDLFIEAGDGEQFETYFFEYKNLDWADVTQKVLPEIKFTDFWGDEKTLPEKKFQRMNLLYELPRIGTTVKVYSKEDYSFNNGMPSDEFNNYYNTFGKRKYSAIELYWNRTSGKFEFGKKIEKKE